MKKFSLIFAATASTLVFVSADASAHDTTVRWPHEGRLWHGGGSQAEVIMLWHRTPGVFTSADKFLEMDIQAPEGYISSCTTMTNLPRPYDDCGTGATLDGSYEAFGFGTYAPTQIYSGSWYTTNYSMTLGTTAQSTAPVNFGWQETTRGWWCGEMSTDPWCLNGHQGGRVHRGTYWRSGKISKSSWLTPQGQTVPRDYSCDVWHDIGCTS
jgi:hypothetical protein